METLQNRQQSKLSSKQPPQKTAAVQPLPRWPRTQKRRSQPVDPIELSRRLHVVYVQQQKAEALAAAGVGIGAMSTVCFLRDRTTTKIVDKESSTEAVQAGLYANMQKLPQVPQHESSQQTARHHLREVSSSKPATATTTTTNPAPSVISQPYVPRQAAQQFGTTTTVSSTWRSGLLNRHRNQPSPHQDSKVALPAAVEAKDALSQEGQQGPRSFVAQHAFEDSLAFPKGSDKGNRHNRKILELANSTASVSVDIAKDNGKDARQASHTLLKRETSNREKAEGDEEKKRDWSIVQPPVDPQIVDDHRVDWTQRDEAVLQFPPPPQPQQQQHRRETKSASVRHSKSLWSIRTRLEGSSKERHPANPNLQEDARAAGAPPASHPSSLPPPSSTAFMVPSKAKAAPKTPRSPKTAIFSLFRHSG